MGKRKTAQEVASRLGAHEPTLRLLLNALVAMRLLNKDGESYGNSAAAATHLVSIPLNISGTCSCFTMRNGTTGESWSRRFEQDSGRSIGMSLRRIPSWAAMCWRYFIGSGSRAGLILPSGCSLTGPVRLLDLGGGAGTNAIAFCQVYPELTATVFDLPATLRLTEKTVKEAGLDSRIALLPGDFNTDGLGGPYDVVLMSDILHYQTFETNAALVKKVLAHLAPGGRLIIKDRFLDEAGTGPAWTTAFAVHILVNTQQGGCYKTSDAIQWMTAAGFVSATELEKTAVVQGLKGTR